MIAITGASGHLGKATTGFLMKKTDPARIVAVVRDPQKMKDISGIQVRAADYDDPASLQAAFKGVSTLLQISSASYGDHATQQEKNVVDAARAAGVQHIVYTSTVNLGGQPIFWGGQTNRQTEKSIQQSGMAHTFFRNSMYLETIPQFIGSAMEDGQIYYPGGNGKVSFLARTEIAEALANVLAEAPRHVNSAYNITGSGAWSFQDVADLLRSEKGLAASYTDIPATAYREELVKFGMQPVEVDFYMSMADSIKAGEFSAVDDTLEGLLQHRRLNLQEYIKSL